MTLGALQIPQRQNPIRAIPLKFLTGKLPADPPPVSFPADAPHMPWNRTSHSLSQ